MRGTLWAACCGLYSPLNLCSVSPHSLQLTFFPNFSLSSCGGGKSYGAVYLFWYGVGSHMSLAGFCTSMTVAWIVRDYHDIMSTCVSVELFALRAIAALLALRTESLMCNCNLALLMLERPCA